MFEKFKNKTIPLEEIRLDSKNPRLVTAQKITDEVEIAMFLLEHEDLPTLMQKVAENGFNRAAERPYVVEENGNYVVLEGNNRIAAYKLFLGMIELPKGYRFKIPSITEELRSRIKAIPCSVAPSRASVDPLLAEMHFGSGDKSKWGYLGSRKAVHDRYAEGRTIEELASLFGKSVSEIRGYLIEFKLHAEAVALGWTSSELNILTDPNVKFNPPVRFLETSGHKEAVGIELDRVNLRISFKNDLAKKKFKHLISKLVINPSKGLGATASYDDVFIDFEPKAESSDTSRRTEHQSKRPSKEKPAAKTSGKSTDRQESHKLKPGALFDYNVTRPSETLKQLMKEARSLNCKTFPGAGTFLLRAILECLLKDVISTDKANPESKALSLEDCILIVKAKKTSIKSSEDLKILSEFNKQHLDYINLGAHANVVPNYQRLMDCRDCIAEFIKKYV